MPQVSPVGGGEGMSRCRRAAEQLNCTGHVLRREGAGLRDALCKLLQLFPWGPPEPRGAVPPAAGGAGQLLAGDTAVPTGLHPSLGSSCLEQQQVSSS